MDDEGTATRTFGVLGMGLSALRSSPARTSLSTLGVVIGVASLVAVLAFGDGLAAMIEGQMGPESSEGAFVVAPSTIERVSSIPVTPLVVADFTLQDLAEVERRVGARGTVALSSQTGLRFATGDPAGVGAASIIAVTPAFMSIWGWRLDRGRALEPRDVEERRAVAVVSVNALSIWGFASPDEALGQPIELLGRTFEVVGVKSAIDWLPGARILIPFTFRDLPELAGSLASMRVGPTNLEDTDQLVRDVQEWLAEAYPGAPYQLQRTDRRMESTIQQIRAMKMIIGAIVGISILVGGIGIMNVMLASVLERTREIGIKRAMGARRRDVLFQFLAESVAVSAFGSLAGLLLGFGIAFGGTAIIRRVTGATVTATLTPGTLLLVSLIAVLVGVVFGAYPAHRAASLTPVDAMRHE
jgi:putative ABC transport system permease protein